MMFQRVAVLVISGLLIACVGGQPPSVDLRNLKSVANDHVQVSFSTDQLSRAEAQELLLLTAALIARKEGGKLFQFRTVSARGLVDELTGAVRYFDVDALIDPLSDGEKGDPVRKTYRSEGVIGFLGPKYRPLLPRALLQKIIATET
jgi:hypothetical protein